MNTENHLTCISNQRRSHRHCTENRGLKTMALISLGATWGQHRATWATNCQHEERADMGGRGSILDALPHWQSWVQATSPPVQWLARIRARTRAHVTIIFAQDLMAAGWDEMFFLHHPSQSRDPTGNWRICASSDALSCGRDENQASSRDLCGELSRLDNILMDLCTSSHIIFHA